jgi:CRP/FNR family transcriptional regulator, cyclic AMP receptor protein
MKKILLIEDNPEMRENTAEILELASYEVITAENGKVGIEKAREGRPDLIVCDIMMPEMDGYGVLYAISKIPTLTSIPFIFLTAKADKTDFRKGMSLGADDYLTKPFDDMELLQAIETRLNKSEFIKKEYERNSEGFNSFVSEVKGFPDLKDLSTNYQIRKYPKKQSIFQEGSYPRYLYLINSGIVKTARSNEEGKEYITGIYKPGDFIGYISLIEDKPYPDSAETLEDTELALIPKEDFLKLLNSNRQVSAKFIKLLTANVSSSEDKLLKLAYDSVRRRVAEALVEMVKSHKLQEDAKPIITLSREDLGNMAGTATESAIRALKDFKDEGLIDLKASHITILNYPKLTKVKS